MQIARSRKGKLKVRKCYSGQIFSQYRGNNMQKIVCQGLKIDLHIHSAFSAHKDGAKVKNNTKDNIPLLIKRLTENEVNICAITDHDVFSFAFYSALKSAEHEENSIQKVFPGVEFSVCFVHEGNEKTVHVVTIFSDEDEDKVKNIESVLQDTPPNHGQSYTEEVFLSLLRKIDINTILIAHQKNSITSKKTRDNDANSLGEQKFLEFIYTDYFEAFEFKNRRNEVLNKTYLLQNGLVDRARFVTGTDCHDWSVYPSETRSEIINDFPFTFVKCLPTFKGLVMAITDHTRMKTVNSFFCAARYTLPSFQLSWNGVTHSVPLSKGINVIIGDNSVGKSMLLHALTGYSKPTSMLSNAVKTGYKKYLESMNISIAKQISDDHIFCFDMQGEVRTKFEENKLNRTDFLSAYFPSSVDSSAYRSMLENEIARMLTYLSKKFELEQKLKNLTTFDIDTAEGRADSLTFLNNIGRAKEKTEKFTDLSLQFEGIATQISAVLNMEIDEDDIPSIKQSEELFLYLKDKYNKRADAINNENTRMEVVSSVIKKKAGQHKRSVSDAQKRMSAFTENTADIKSQLVDLIRASRELTPYTPSLQLAPIRINSNRVFDYEFISKLTIEEISTEYFISLLKRILKTGKTIDWATITEKELQDMLLRYDNSPVLQFVGNALRIQIEADLQPKHSIIFQGMDKYAEMSAGLDAKVYFDLLAYEMQRDGIYLIDQPEDNISQSAIREYLLDRFKTMGENRQIIMITHNPQFIVNLDVDNLIFLSKKNGVLNVQSGALEYTCTDYNILDIVAQNIDGGLDSIRKRWKRYEKTANL